MKKLFLMALGATMLVSCYTQAELDEHKETYELLALQADSRADAAIAAANATIDELSSALQIAGQTAAQLEAAVAEATAQIAALNEANIEKGAEIDLLNGIIADAEDKIADLEAENAELNAQLDALQSNLSAALARIQDLEDNPITITEYITVVETVVETVEVINTIVETVEVPGETITVTNTVTTGVSQEELDNANDLVEQLLKELSDLATASQISENLNLSEIADLKEQLSDLVSQYDGLEVTYDESSEEGLLEADAISGFGFDFNDDGDELDTYTESTVSWTITNAEGEVIASSSVSSYDITTNVAPEVDPTDVIVSDVSVSQSGGVETTVNDGDPIVEVATAGTDVEFVTETTTQNTLVNTTAVIETTVTTYSVDVKGIEDSPALVAPESTTVSSVITAASSVAGTPIVTTRQVDNDAYVAPVEDTNDEIISSVSTSQSGGVETLTTAGTFGEWVSNGNGTESRSKTDVYSTSAVIETTVTTYSVQINGVEDSPALVAPESTSTDEEITAASTRDDVVTETQNEAPAFDAKDLDEDGDVDVADAIAAGYSFTINPGLFGGEAAEAFLNGTSLSGFDSAFLYDDVAQATTAVEAFILTHYNNN